MQKKNAVFSAFGPNVGYKKRRAGKAFGLHCSEAF